MMPSNQSLLIIVITVISCFLQLSNTVHANLFGLLKKNNQYTPLVFFTVPKGTSKECDEMEKIISSIEKETKTKVQRFDILRDRYARNLYEKIDEIQFVGKVPLLYHRESRQTVYGLDSKARIKAWAKGRWLSPKMVDGREGSKKFVPDEEDGVEEQMDGFIEDNLTELQQLGREKMLERMEQGRK